MQLTLGMLLPPRYDSMLLLLGMLLSLGMLLPSGHAASPGHAALPGACWSILIIKRHFYIIFYGVSRYTHYLYCIKDDIAPYTNHVIQLIVNSLALCQNIFIPVLKEAQKSN
jgi:hypothetical protein